MLNAQELSLPHKQLELKDLSVFEKPSSNWIIAGDQFMDAYRDHHIEPREGWGVLVNTAKGETPEDLNTRWSHGDLDLELEVMMAKGSNSGIYLQGRYEIQLLDSWGVEEPSFSDIGGVYQWWEDGKGVGGIPPAVNAARPPDYGSI
ncbi:MAG: family 16 glycoside hydrolase [Balneolaceae bacterium]|nr:family 16 glycoside hydrolase [Balneolaceae bacterium]